MCITHLEPLRPLIPFSPPHPFRLILEVGVGGAYDSTNIVPRPIVAGVSALGIDHVGILGKTIPEIAWQKGGIYKVCFLDLSSGHRAS